MYYLEQKQFKPAMVLFGLLFIPILIGINIANVVFFRVELLIVSLVVLIVYLSIILFFWRLSKRKEHYLLINKNGVEILFHDSIRGKIKVELSFEQIIKIEYYRINSIRSWFMLYSYVFPKCVYITYKIGGEEQTKFIGYMDLKDIKQIANDKNIKLIVN